MRSTMSPDGAFARLHRLRRCEKASRDQRVAWNKENLRIHEYTLTRNILFSQVPHPEAMVLRSPARLKGSVRGCPSSLSLGFPSPFPAPASVGGSS